MRATTILVSAASLSLLTGCGTVRGLTDLPEGCPPNIDNAVTLTYGNSTIDLDDECVVVMGGSNVTMTITRKTGAQVRDVRTKKTKAFQRWLDHDHDGSGTIVFVVPQKKDPRNTYEDHKYEIQIPGVGMLDPRIVIQ